MAKRDYLKIIRSYCPKCRYTECEIVIFYKKETDSYEQVGWNCKNCKYATFLTLEQLKTNV